jgi:hypothetical protein
MAVLVRESAHDKASWCAGRAADPGAGAFDGSASVPIQRVLSPDLKVHFASPFGRTSYFLAWPRK